MRFFNTSGPVVPADHYCIPPLSRVDPADVLQLVHNKRCFVLHAPRQTGKTSVLLALRDLLNGGETYFDQLADKLQEDRVRRVVEPLLSGDDERGFDRDEGRSWEEKVFCRKESVGGVEVVVWGM